jgi:acetyl-CoA C-acetyltransferase
MATVILSAQRTPIGGFMGGLAPKTAPELGAVAIKAALEKAGVSADKVSEVIMGNVLSGGVGQAPARQAAIYADMPKSVECMTINKVCGSGLKAVMLADQVIRSGDNDLIVAGGMESMTNAPHALKGARNGYKMGSAEMVDLMIHDGLWDVYNNFHMGNAGELCASEHSFTREAQDEYAKKSYELAIAAQENGYFNDEITPVTISGRKGDVTIDTDEDPGKVRFDKISSLRPVFKKDGTVTAANASNLNDGASATVVASEEYAKDNSLTPLAKIVAHCSYAHQPEQFTTAPTSAIQKVLKKANMTLDQIDLFEINEAFSVVPMHSIKELGIDRDKVNVHGGAVALGHPIGASGNRLLTTLIHALKRTGGKYGLVTLCIGGGEANAMIIEMA